MQMRCRRWYVLQSNTYIALASSQGVCCIRCTRDVENRNRVVFLEHWLDRDALRVHFGVPESRAFAKALRSLATESTLDIYEANRVEL